MAGLNSQAHALPEDRNEEIFRDKVMPMHIACQPGYQREGTGRAWILGGQPGAGKTNSIKKRSAWSAENGRLETAVQISTDQFRVEHDKWVPLLEVNDELACFYTNSDARAWVDKAAGHLMERHCDILVDATLSDALYARQLVDRFISGGYRVKVVFVATPRAISLFGNVARYYGLSKELRRPARTCMRSTYGEVCDGVIQTASRIDDRSIRANAVRVTCRVTGDETYRFDEGQGAASIGGAAEAIRNEQARVWTPAETEAFLADYSELHVKMTSTDPKWQVWFDDIRSLAEPCLAAEHEFPALDEAA